MSTSSRIATDLTDEDAMPLTAPRPLRSLILLVCAALLAACQSLPRPSGFTAEQIAVLTSEGFTAGDPRSEEHTSELQSLMRNSYAVFCLTKKKKIKSQK